MQSQLDTHEERPQPRENYKKCKRHDEAARWRGNQGSGNSGGSGGAAPPISAKKPPIPQQSGTKKKKRNSRQPGGGKRKGEGRRRSAMASGDSDGEGEEEHSGGEEEDQDDAGGNAVTVTDKQDDYPDQDLSNGASISHPVEQSKPKTPAIKFQEAGVRKQSIPRAMSADESVEVPTHDQDESREERYSDEAVEK